MRSSLASNACSWQSHPLMLPVLHHPSQEQLPVSFAVATSLSIRKPQILIAIHSPSPHLTLQMGGPKEEKNCLALCYMLDFSALLSTANFHYMEAVIKQYPHILKASYLPNNYASIITWALLHPLTRHPSRQSCWLGSRSFFCT